MKRHPVLLVILIAFIASCSPKVPFTQGIRDKYKLNESELKSLQFYTSDVIVLKRGEMGEKSKETSEGTLTIKGGNKVDKIIIKAGTPCIVDQVYDGNRISVVFEDGKNKYLVFGSLNDRNGYYTLQMLNENNRATINYGEKLYYVSTGSDPIFLVFKIHSLNKFELNEQVVKGKKIH
jgi:hypothetical protein